MLEWRIKRKLSPATIRGRFRWIRTDMLQTSGDGGSFGAPRLSAWLGLIGFVAVSGASRASPPDVVAEMRACTTEQNDSRRLACYDHAVGRTPNGPLHTAAPQPQAQAAPTGPAAAALAEQQFGMNPELARKQAGPDAVPRLKEIHARVTALSRQHQGEPVVTLENGQVWKAKPGETGDTLKVGDLVTIWTGAMGSYHLSVGHRSMDVTRVQ